MTIRVLVADDQELVRAGSGMLLAQRAGHRGRRGGGGRRRGGAAGPATCAAGRRADGHPDAAARRPRGDPADPSRATGAAGAGADDLRPRRVRVRGAARRRQRLPAQGRPAGELVRRDPDGGGRGGAAGAGGHPAADRAVHAAARGPTRPPELDDADRAGARGAAAGGARGCPTRRSRRGCSSARRR